MDDSFAFRTTVPLRHRLDARLVKAAFFGTLLVVAVALFARWVMASERESFSRTTRGELLREAPADQVDGLIEVSTEDAVEATEIALAAFRVAFLEHRSFLDAGPAQLSALQPGYTFVDGPSTTPEIVSVAATAHTWAASVQGPGGACFWVRATSAGDVTRGIGSECTGSAALRPAPPR
jgi:hypothetical protein